MSQENKVAPKLYSLLVGIDCYLPDEKSGTRSSVNLGGCVRDINGVEEFLRNQLDVPGSHILKLTSTDVGAALPAEPPEKWPTRQNIVEGFEWLGRVAGPGDQLYIHYSGHGGRVRTPPRFQHIKGVDGFDEALVPSDFSRAKDSFLRDFELAQILSRYVERGLVVTVVLDSCHSGSATRGVGLFRPVVGDGANVRSIGIIDEVLPPPERAVASDEELAAACQTLSRAPMRDFEVESGWLIEPKGYVLLAACRASEYAYEHGFDGGESTGVFTYWLLDSLKTLGPGVTFKTLYDRVLAKVHSHFQRQTPQLQGDPGRVIFEGGLAHSPPSIAVLHVAEAENEVVLNVGQAQGVRTGARFAVFPQGETDFTLAERRRALLSILTLGATSSRATINKRLRDEAIEPGDQAVLLESGTPQVQRTIRLVPAENGGPGGERRLAALRALEHALARCENGFVRLAEDGAPADFFISVGEENEYVISDAGGEAFANLPPGPRIADAGAAAQLTNRLVHLTKYLNVYGLDNCDPFSPLRRKVSALLLGVQADYLMGDKPEPRPFETGAGVPTLKAGEWTFLKIQNDSTQVLNITVLDLRPNWSIRQIYPAGAAFYEPLDPGLSLTLPLRAALPRGCEAGRDVIKILATTGASNFRWLELPALERQAGGPVWRGDPTTRLEQFLEAFMRDGPGARDLIIEAAANHEWTTTQVEINVHLRGARRVQESERE